MKNLFVAIAILALASCASIESRRAPSDKTLGENPAAGLSYFLPMRGIRITYTAPSAAPPTHTIVVATTESYPDASQQFFLRFSRNEIGISKMNVVITSRGLLTSAVSDVDSQLNEVLSDAAKTVGALAKFAPETGDMPPAEAAAQPTCIPGQAYVTTFIPNRNLPEGDVPICGAVRVRIQRVLSSSVKAPGENVPEDKAHIDKAPQDKAPQDKAPQDKAPQDKAPVETGVVAGSGNGIYYRQDQPYLVEVLICPTAKNLCPKQESVLHSALVGVPNLSHTYFLPVNKTLFGKNVATLTFNDGVATGYQQDFDGEFLSVAKIPFEVVSAFFAGVGSVFDSRKAVADKEAAYQEAVAKLAARQLKTERCMQALRTKNDQGMTDYCQ